MVLTRPPEKDAELKAGLKRLGVEARSLPVVAYEALPEGLVRLEALLTEPWDWVVVTSPEAAEHFGRVWASRGRPPLAVAAVGESTRQALLRLGISARFLPPRATARDLGETLPGSGRVLWPASARAGSDLSDGLRRRGFSVHRVDIYTLRPRVPDERERAVLRGAGAVAFGSPSAVRAWLAAELPRLPAGCVGAVTARVARKAGFPEVRYPEAPGLEGWMFVLARLAGRVID